MPYRRRRSYRPRKRAIRKYKRPKTKSARSAKKMQNSAFTYVTKKYTVVNPLRIAQGNDSLQATISHIGGRNAANPGSTITVADADPDGMASADMNLYQFFKISGVAFKVFFPEGTTPAATPV